MQSPAAPAPAPARLLQLRSDRRLGHEWDDWDGEPLPGDGVHHEGPGLFFRLAALGGAATLVVGGAVVWVAAPRLERLWALLPALLVAALALGGLLLALWLAALAWVLRRARNPLPPFLAEGRAVPWAMPRLERLGVRLGISRDRVGNSLMRVHNGLTAARARPGVRPDDLLVLLPRCLGKEAMQAAMEVAGRYGVPLFVASRGRYAREMIASRRPQRVVAVACERDLASGVHDVGPRLPVLGVTLSLPDGPCRNTGVDPAALEAAVRRFLGLDGPAGP